MYPPVRTTTFSRASRTYSAAEQQDPPLSMLGQDEHARTGAQVTLAAFVGVQQLFPAERLRLLKAVVKPLLSRRNQV